MTKSHQIYSKLRKNFEVTAEAIREQKLKEQQAIASQKVKLLVNRYTPEQIEAKVEDIQKEKVKKEEGTKPTRKSSRRKKNEVTKKDEVE